MFFGGLLAYATDVEHKYMNTSNGSALFFLEPIGSRTAPNQVARKLAAVHLEAQLRSALHCGRVRAGRQAEKIGNSERALFDRSGGVHMGCQYVRMTCTMCSRLQYLRILGSTVAAGGRQTIVGSRQNHTVHSYRFPA